MVVMKKEFIGIPFDIKIVGLKGRGEVLELALRTCDHEALIVSMQSVSTPLL